MLGTHRGRESFAACDLVCIMFDSSATLFLGHKAEKDIFVYLIHCKKKLSLLRLYAEYVGENGHMISLIVCLCISYVFRMM